MWTVLLVPLITWLVIIPIYYCVGYVHGKAAIARRYRNHFLFNHERSSAASTPGELAEALGYSRAVNDMYDVIYHRDNEPLPIRVISKVWRTIWRKGGENGLKWNTWADGRAGKANWT